MSFAQRPPPGLLIAQTIGITSSLYLFGTISSISILTVPAIMQAPAPMAVKQWDHVFQHGGLIARPLAIVTALATAYVTYQHAPSSTPFKLNAAATILIPSIIPFTIFLIGPTNTKLMAKRDQLASASLEDKAVEANVAEGETVHALIDKWATLNLARSLLVAAGSLCTILAVVNNAEFSSFEGVKLASGANRMG